MMTSELARAMTIFLKRACNTPEEVVDILDEIYFEITGLTIKLEKKEREDETIHRDYRQKDDHMPDL